MGKLWEKNSRKLIKPHKKTKQSNRHTGILHRRLQNPQQNNGKSPEQCRKQHKQIYFRMLNRHFDYFCHILHRAAFRCNFPPHFFQLRQQKGTNHGQQSGNRFNRNNTVAQNRIKNTAGYRRGKTCRRSISRNTAVFLQKLLFPFHPLQQIISISLFGSGK